MSSTSNVSVSAVGWIALATGVVGILAFAFIILLFSVGQPFGTFNDICLGIMAVLSGVLALGLYPQHYAHAPLLSRLALVAALLGALIALFGSVLVISGATGWFQASLYSAVGYALIGAWLLALNYSVRSSGAWEGGLVIAGMIIGGIMLFGFLALPGILSRVDAWDVAPWYVSYIGEVGGVGYLVLYPFWCILVGRTLLSA